jgi:hypothetical protein
MSLWDFAADKGKGKAKGEDQGAGKGKVWQALARTRALEEQEEGQGQEQPSLWLCREVESSRLHCLQQDAWTFQGGTWHQKEPWKSVRAAKIAKRNRILKCEQKQKRKWNQKRKWIKYPGAPGPVTRQIIRQVLAQAQHRFQVHSALQMAFLRSQVPQGPVPVLPRVRGSAAKGAAQGIQDEPAQAAPEAEQGEDKGLSKGALQEFAGKLAALQARHDLAAAKGKANSARVLAAAKGRVLAALQARHDLAAAEDRADSARALVASRERVLQTALAAAKLQC